MHIFRCGLFQVALEPLLDVLWGMLAMVYYSTGNTGIENTLQSRNFALEKIDLYTFDIQQQLT